MKFALMALMAVLAMEGKLEWMLFVIFFLAYLKT